MCISKNWTFDQREQDFHEGLERVFSEIRDLRFYSHFPASFFAYSQMLKLVRQCLTLPFVMVSRLLSIYLIGDVIYYLSRMQAFIYRCFFYIDAA